jgi:hypothetical protein
MRPWGVSAAGQKKGIFGLRRAKAGQYHLPDETLAEFASRDLLRIEAAGVRGIDRCYEPASRGIRDGDSPAGREIREALITTS